MTLVKDVCRASKPDVTSTGGDGHGNGKALFWARESSPGWNRVTMAPRREQVVAKWCPGRRAHGPGAQSSSPSGTAPGSARKSTLGRAAGPMFTDGTAGDAPVTDPNAAWDAWACGRARTGSLLWRPIAHGRELWVTDGTTTGTRLVADMSPERRLVGGGWCLRRRHRLNCSTDGLSSQLWAATHGGGDLPVGHRHGFGASHGVAGCFVSRDAEWRCSGAPTGAVGHRVALELLPGHVVAMAGGPRASISSSPPGSRSPLDQRRIGLGTGVVPPPAVPLGWDSSTA